MDLFFRAHLPRGFRFGTLIGPATCQVLYVVEANLRTLFVVLSLPPIVGVVNEFGLDVELSMQRFYQCLCPFNLEVGRRGGFAVGYNADMDSLTVVVGLAWYDRPLSLPFFS